jgi:putative IMPACT (imprinted ancient) family translation regulator
MVVVTRYYGGTKLGVGGLVRAYGEVAGLALEEAPRLRGIVAARLRVRYPYEHTSAVMRCWSGWHLRRSSTGTAEEGTKGRWSSPWRSPE